MSTLELLKFTDDFEIGDLDLQGQIGLQTSKILVFHFYKINNLNFTFQIKLFFDDLNVSKRFGNW